MRLSCWFRHAKVSYFSMQLGSWAMQEDANQQRKRCDSRNLSTFQLNANWISDANSRVPSAIIKPGRIGFSPVASADLSSVRFFLLLLMISSSDLLFDVLWWLICFGWLGLLIKKRRKKKLMKTHSFVPRNNLQAIIPQWQGESDREEQKTRWDEQRKNFFVCHRMKRV